MTPGKFKTETDNGKNNRGRRPRHQDEGRRGGDRRNGGQAGNGRANGAKPRRERRDTERRAPVRAETPTKPEQEFRFTIPSTPERMLFKGIDCEVNGRRDLALVLYLHGAARLSGGCENNAVRLLREMGSAEFPTARGRVAKNYTGDVLVAFDYLCSTIDGGYDRGFLRAQADEGNMLAIYSRIRLGEVEGDDPCIDVFASGADGNGKMVVDGLKILVRKKDSVKAEGCLKAIEKREKTRQSIRPAFVRALKGDAQSVRRLEELSPEFPEAGFLAGYLDADDKESYLREGMGSFQTTVLSVVPELGISDTPYGRYLAAKRLQTEGEDWIPRMIDAAAAGSEDAVADLMPVQNRKDVRKGLSSASLARGDAAGLVRYYDGEDTTYLDRYCAGNPTRTIEVGRLMGGTREIDWLKRGCIEGIPECRDELVSLASSEDRRCKQLVYALHDVGAEMDAAKLYFDMYGDRSLPSVKWLAKVCADEDAKRFVRSKFEEMGDLATFESIFVDDGYERHDRKRSVRHR